MSSEEGGRIGKESSVREGRGQERRGEEKKKRKGE